MDGSSGCSGGACGCGGRCGGLRLVAPVGQESLCVPDGGSKKADGGDDDRAQAGHDVQDGDPGARSGAGEGTEYRGEPPVRTHGGFEDLVGEHASGEIGDGACDILGHLDRSEQASLKVGWSLLLPDALVVAVDEGDGPPAEEQRDRPDQNAVEAEEYAARNAQ